MKLFFFLSWLFVTSLSCQVCLPWGSQALWLWVMLPAPELGTAECRAVKHWDMSLLALPGSHLAHSGWGADEESGQKAMQGPTPASYRRMECPRKSEVKEAGETAWKKAVLWEYFQPTLPWEPAALERLFLFFHLLLCFQAGVMLLWACHWNSMFRFGSFQMMRRK